MDSVWTPARINAMWIGTVICAIVAGLVGVLYGAWAIFQPFPQTNIGPVSAYVIGAVVLCLVAGWQIGKRALMVEKGYGDPGWTVPVILVALAVGSMGIWSASLSASVHTPEASISRLVQTPAPSQAAPLAPSLSQEQTDIISKSCGGGQYRSCASEASRDATLSLGQYKVAKELCLGYQGMSDQTAQTAFSRCRREIWNVQGIKMTFQQNIQSACDRAAAYVAKMPVDQQADAELLRCDAIALAFINTQPATWENEPPGV
jgi:hypothetical protein